MKSRVWSFVIGGAALAIAGWLIAKLVGRKRSASPTEWQTVEPLGEEEATPEPVGAEAAHGESGESAESGDGEEPDPVEEAMAESFPASDPPSWNAGR